MKILHLIYSFNTGGSETMLVDIANEQVKQAEVSIVVINRIYNETLLNKIDKRVKVYLINRTESSKNPFSALKLNIILMILNAEVLHCHNHNIIPILLPWLRGKSVLTLHCLGIPSKYLGKYHQLFAISESVRKDVISRTNINSTVVYNGISTNAIVTKQDYSVKNYFRIVCVGRLEHNLKGQHLVLEALHLLNEKGFSNIRLDLIGSGSSDEYLKEMTTIYELTEQVSFLGLKDRDYIYVHLKDYDLLVQPSLFEGFGLTVAEGMAAKVPVLVSNVEGPMEIIGKGKYGFHFEAGNAKKLAESIQHISKYNSDLLKMGANEAFLHVIENFDIKSTASKYLQNYLIINELYS